MIKFEQVKKEQKELFWNINQKYLYEMTNYYDNPIDENGNIDYGYFDEYFIDPKRKAYFIYNDETLIGFIMVCPYSNLDKPVDYVMAEFTVFPHFRNQGFGLESANKIINDLKGKWEIKYNEKNIVAKHFWTKITLKYNPTIYHLNDVETVLSFNNSL